MKALLLLFIAPLISAEFSFESGLGGAYRQDHFSHLFHDESDRNTFRSTYESLKMGQLQGFALAQYGWFFARFDGDGAWGSSSDGTYDAGFPHQQGGITRALFRGDVTAEAFDIMGSGGISFPVFKNENHRFEFVPFGGYDLRHLKINHGGVRPQTTILTLPGLIAPVEVSLDLETLRTDWWGPFAGFELVWIFLKSWKVMGSYAYHWPNFKVDQTLSFPATFVGIPNSLTTSTSTVDSSNKGGFGQRYKGSLSYLGHHWFCTLFGTFLYYQTKVRRVDIQNVQEGFLHPNGPTFTESQNDYKSHWKTYTVGLEVGFHI